MASTLRIKRRVSGAAGAPASLKTGELAWNMADGYIYGGFGDDGSGNATSIKILTKQDWVDPSGTYQPVDADLTALAALDATAGIITKTGANTYARRTITGTAGRIGVTNGSGSGGDPTIDLATVTVGSTVAGGHTKFTVDGYGRITNAGQMSLSDASAPTADFAFGGFKLTGLGTPTADNDAANKAYVDNAMFGMDAKASVRVATTGNQALSGGTAFPTIDGVTVAAADRVLLKSQTAPAENGIYVVGGSGAAWTLTRATDMNAWDEVPGAMTTVEEGTVNADSVWIATANRGGTLNTTAIAWTRIDAGAGGGFTVAGAGLTSSGATIDIGTGAGLTTTADAIALTGQALALHNVATAADKLIYATGSGTFNTTDLTSVARTLLSQTTQALMRTTGLGLGTMSTQDANNVAISGGTIDGVTMDGGTF